MKLYYCDVYARAEPVRMALWKAGVDFENITLTVAQWREIKPATGLGSMPMLELDDGTQLF